MDVKKRMTRAFVRAFVSVYLLHASGTAIYAQTTLAQQSFGGDAGSWAFTPYPEPFTYEDDVWDVTNSLGTLTNMPAEGSAFWGIQDLYESDVREIDWGKLEFDAVHVADYKDVTVSFQYEADAFDQGDKLAYALYSNKSRRDTALFFDGKDKDNEAGTISLQVHDASHVARIILYVKQNGTDDYAGFDNVMMQGTARTGTNDACADDLFFSEYAEGSSHNKYVEISNQTCNALDLSNYRLNLARNEGDWGSKLLDLPATNLNSGDTWVIADDANDVDATIKDQADQFYTWNGWNGDDALALEKDEGSWRIIDQVGDANCTYCKEVAGVSNALEDHTLRRKATVVSGTDDWNYSAGHDAASSEWIVANEDDFSGIGEHKVPFVWMGYFSSAWDEPANWNWNVLPGADNSVSIVTGACKPAEIAADPSSPAIWNDLTIEQEAAVVVKPGKALTINDRLTNNAGAEGLVVQAEPSGASGSLIHAENGVQASVQVFFEGTQWHYIASPIAGKATEDFNPNNFLHWDAAKEWGGVGDSSPWKTYQQNQLQPGRGYAYYYYQSMLHFNGELNQGEYTVNLSRSASGESAKQGWNLTGNPYPSYLDWDAMVAGASFPDETTEMESAVYFFDDSAKDGKQENYRYYVPPDGTGGTGVGTEDASAFIPPGQGFFVRALQDNVALTFKNSFRVHKAQTLYKNSPALLRLVIRDGQRSDECIIYHHDKATPNFDARLDARKLFPNNTDIPMLYAMDADLQDNMAINSININSQNAEIPLAVKVKKAKQYSLQVKENTLPSSIYLYDKQEDKLTRLSEGTKYAFFALKNQLDDRFRLLVNESVNIEPVTGKRKAAIYNKGSELLLKLPEINERIAMRIYGNEGRLVQKQIYEGQQGKKRVYLDVAPGVYVVQLVIYDEVIAKKIVIR